MFPPAADRDRACLPVHREKLNLYPEQVWKVNIVYIRVESQHQLPPVEFENCTVLEYHKPYKKCRHAPGEHV